MHLTPYRGVQARRIGSSSHTALHLNFIIFFSNTWLFICYGFHRNRVANRSSISRKKGHLSPLLRSWSIGKCSVRTISLSSSLFSLLGAKFNKKTTVWKSTKFGSTQNDSHSLRSMGRGSNPRWVRVWALAGDILIESNQLYPDRVKHDSMNWKTSGPLRETSTRNYDITKNSTKYEN